MKRIKFRDNFSLRLSESTRIALEQLADSRELAMAELARKYIAEGLRRDGIEC